METKYKIYEQRWLIGREQMLWSVGFPSMRGLTLQCLKHWQPASSSVEAEKCPMVEFLFLFSVDREKK